MDKPVAAAATRIETVMAAIESGIAARRFLTGDRLPSVRAFAASMHVSTSTVVEAYERLAADGVIRSRPGSGFFVAAPLAPLSLAEISPRFDRQIDPFWISRQSLEAGDAMLKPGCGWLPADWMHGEGLRRALRTLARGGDAALADYATPLGEPLLRQLLVRRMAERDIDASTEQVMLTDSGTQAIDLVCRLLLEPGQTVLVDDPCYFNFHALLRAHRAHVVGIPFTPSGPDLERFAEALAVHKPRLYITNSALHNPTGATLSTVTAHRLLKLADQANLTIVEDDIFADFETVRAPRLAALDGLANVIHIGSFSKTLSASVRTGFIAARPDWIDSLVDLRIATTFSGGRLAQDMLAMSLRDGSYRRHVETLRSRLADAMGETIDRLERLGIIPWLKPSAGIFVWARLPDGIDAADIARACLKDDIVLAPGNAFSLSQTASGFLRFNVAQSADARIFHSLERALTTKRPSSMDVKERSRGGFSPV